jgi:hypothetical protein
MSRKTRLFGIPRIDTLEPRMLLSNPGDLDPSFSDDGKATISGFGSASAVAVQADGKTVVAGFGSLARFNIDGTMTINLPRRAFCPMEHPTRLLTATESGRSASAFLNWRARCMPSRCKATARSCLRGT